MTVNVGSKGKFSNWPDNMHPKGVGVDQRLAVGRRSLIVRPPGGTLGIWVGQSSMNFLRLCTSWTIEDQSRILNCILLECSGERPITQSNASRVEPRLQKLRKSIIRFVIRVCKSSKNENRLNVTSLQREYKKLNVWSGARRIGRRKATSRHQGFESGLLLH